MILAVTAVAVLGFWFSSTRAVALAATGILAAIFPWLAVLILIGSAAAFFVFRISK